MTDNGDVCFVRSTLDDDGKAAVLMKWGPIEALLTPDVVLTTGRDLMAAAVSAETDIALIQTFREDLGAEDEMLGLVLAKVRGRRPVSGGKPALRISAVAGARTGRPLVHIGRGSMKGELSPDEARGMAVDWIQTAVAAQIDVRMRYALGEWDRLTTVEIDDLFRRVQEVAR